MGLGDSKACECLLHLHAAAQLRLVVGHHARCQRRPKKFNDLSRAPVTTRHYQVKGLVTENEVL